MRACDTCGRFFRETALLTRADRPNYGGRSCRLRRNALRQKSYHSNETAGTSEAAAGVPETGIADFSKTEKRENSPVLQAFAKIPSGETKESTIKKSPDGFGFPGVAAVARQADIAEVFNTDMLENRRVLQAFA